MANFGWLAAGLIREADYAMMLTREMYSFVGGNQIESTQISFHYRSTLANDSASVCTGDPELASNRSCFDLAPSAARIFEIGLAAMNIGIRLRLRPKFLLAPASVIFRRRKKVERVQGKSGGDVEKP